MSLDFIPRKLQKRTAKQTAKFANEIQLSEPQVSHISQERKGKQKATQDAVSEEAISTCLELAFSDYTLSEDEGIRALISSVGEEECKFFLRWIHTDFLTRCSHSPEANHRA
jgi:hypothetical protein